MQIFLGKPETEDRVLQSQERLVEYPSELALWPDYRESVEQFPVEVVPTIDDRAPGAVFTGREHGRNFAYYASDDEDMTDQDDLDELSYQVWLDAERDPEFWDE